MKITNEQRQRLDDLETQLALAIKHQTWCNLSGRYAITNNFVNALLEIGLDMDAINSYLDKLECYAKREQEAFEARLKAFKELLDK